MSHFSQQYLTTHRIGELHAEADRERLVREAMAGRRRDRSPDSPRRARRPGVRTTLASLAATLQR